MPKKLTNAEYLAKIQGRGVTPLEEYRGTMKKIMHRFDDCGHSYPIHPNAIIYGRNCGICHKKTNEDYDKQIKHLPVIRLEDYAGDSVKILHKFIECGHEALVIPSGIIQGSGCLECCGRKRKTNSVYDEQIKGMGISRIGDYVSNSVKILHKHHDCGHIVLARPNDILRGYGCGECNPRKLKSESQYDAEIQGMGVVRLEPYINATKKILHRYESCGHTVSVVPNSVRVGHGCRVCSGTILKSNEKYDEELVNLGVDVTRLEDYKGASTKILHRFEKCGHENEIVPSSVLNGIGCHKCCNRGFDKSKEAILYYLKWNGKYKIGITNNDVQKRYHDYDLESLGVDVLFERAGSGRSVLRMESRIKRKFKNERTAEPITVLGHRSNHEWFSKDVLGVEDRP